MARGPAVPVNPAVLVWGRTAADLTVEEASKAIGTKPARLEDWEAGGSRPTLNQLRNLARVYRRTPATFFLRSAPPSEDDSRPPDFRGRNSKRIGPSLMRELAKARERRDAFVRLVGEPVGFLPELDNVLREPEEAAATLRTATGVSVGQQARWRDAQAALTGWVRTAESMGVLVFHMSGIEPSECRGLSEYHSVNPVIILNGAERPEWRTFTLFHELAHLLSHSGGVCDVWRGLNVEARCNRFAGAFLMPAESIAAAIGDNVPDDLSALAQQYRVSQSAVAVRLRSLGHISQDRLEEHLSRALRMSAETREREREKQRASDSFVPRYQLQLRNLGATYVSTVLEAMHRDAIGPVDAALLLESKMATVNRMEDELARRSAR